MRMLLLFLNALIGESKKFVVDTAVGQSYLVDAKNRRGGQNVPAPLSYRFNTENESGALNNINLPLGDLPVPEPSLTFSLGFTKSVFTLIN